MPNVPGHADHGTPPAPFYARARKFLVAAFGLVVQVITSGVLDAPEYDGVRVWVQAAIGIATAAGVYQVKNAKA